MGEVGARRSDPPTSWMAARAKSWRKVRRTAERGIAQFGRTPFHDQQLADLVGDARNIVARERKTLVEIGWVEPCMDTEGQRRVRGPRGRDVLLWQFTERAVEGKAEWPQRKKRTHSQLSMDV